MKNNYTVYTKKETDSSIDFQFIESDELPADMPVSTPMNFVFIGSELVLVLDKNSWWGPVCGKIEHGENWEEALIRETEEEVGVEVSSFNLCGYVVCNNYSSDNFPPKTVLPVCYSFFDKINFDWTPNETRDRGLFSQLQSKNKFKNRGDNNQILEIFSFILEKLTDNIRVEYKFIPGEILPNIISTSAMVFCLNNNREICIVKDGDENFYSLPGGGRDLTESILDCAKRELFEESQIVAKNYKVFGTILVEFYEKDMLVSRMQQVRYLCEVEKISDFVPYKDGHETDERKFVSSDNLIDLVKQFQNNSGQEIVNYLKTLI